MTTQPWAPIFGDHSFDTAPPADIRQMSVPLKSKFSSDLHFRVLSPKETSVPIDRGEASCCDLIGREPALGQYIEHFPPDISCRANNGDFETHRLLHPPNASLQSLPHRRLTA